MASSLVERGPHCTKRQRKLEMWLNVFIHNHNLMEYSFFFYIMAMQLSWEADAFGIGTKKVVFSIVFSIQYHKNLINIKMLRTVGSKPSINICRIFKLRTWFIESPFTFTLWSALLSPVHWISVTSIFSTGSCPVTRLCCGLSWFLRSSQPWYISSWGNRNLQACVKWCWGKSF